MNHAHIVCHGRDPNSHQHTWGGAFGKGLEKHGWTVTYGSATRACDLLVLWGVRRRDWIARQKAAGGEVCILERGYLGDRFFWTSVSFGGELNGRAEFRGPFHDGSRWEKYFAHLMQPWRPKDGPVVIMGQVPGDQAVRDIDITRWCKLTAEHLKARGHKVVIRPHPKVCAGAPLEEVLAGAKMAVTFNSNSGVDAVLAGVPTIAVDRGSMAWDVAGHDLDQEPPTPDRTAWAHRLAWCQWTMDEMRSGECWAAIRNSEARIYAPEGAETASAA